MSIAFKHPVPPTLNWPQLALVAARHWGRARDRAEAVRPALYEALNGAGLGLLAPVVDSLFRIYEGLLGRRFQTASEFDGWPTGDEQALLEFIENRGESDRPSASGRKDLLVVALRSTRIMLRLEGLSAGGSLPVVGQMCDARLLEPRTIRLQPA